MERVTMFKRLPETEVRLGKHRLVRLSGYHPGTAIVCKQGTLWVTQTGDQQDHILTPGEEFTSSRHGAVLIEAMRDAAMSIERSN